MSSSPQVKQKLGKNAQQFLQTMTVLAWFQSHPQGTFMQASKDLGISTPQIQHELKQLSLCGLPGYFPGSLIEITMNRLSATAEFAAGLDRPLRLTTMEAGVLLLNLETIRDSLPPEYKTAADSVAEKLRDLVKTNRKSPENRSSANPDAIREKTNTEKSAEEDSLLSQLRRAIGERRMATMTYTSVSKDETGRRTVIPDGLVLIDGSRYLVGRYPAQSEMAETGHRHFKLDRISSLHLEETGSAPKILAPTVDETDPFDFESSENWATLSLKTTAAWMLEYFPMWLAEDRTAGPVVEIPDTGSWLERFIVANNQNIEDVQPTAVRDRVQRRAKEGLKVYRERFPHVN